MLPDANTDVCINKGKLNYPLLNFSQAVKSISQQSGTKVEVANGSSCWIQVSDFFIPSYILNSLQTCKV